MYRASPYAISRALFDIPTLMVGIFIFGTILYWMAGLNSNPGMLILQLSTKATIKGNVDRHFVMREKQKHYLKAFANHE